MKKEKKVNNKDNNYIVYYGKDINGKVKSRKCKNKADYQKAL